MQIHIWFSDTKAHQFLENFKIAEQILSVFGWIIISRGPFNVIIKKDLENQDMTKKINYSVLFRKLAFDI